MKILLSIIFFLLTIPIINAQAPDIEWQNRIGGNDKDELQSIHQTTDGGYILGGWSKSGISGDKTEQSDGKEDYWVVKLNSTGNIEWQNTIGGDFRDFLYSIQQTTDGGYILGGYSQSNISGDKTEASMGSYDYWIIKLDVIGNIDWQKTIGGSGVEFLYSIQQTTDGGYILGGHTGSDISGDMAEASKGNYDYWIVKLVADAPLKIESTIHTSALGELSVLPAYPNPFNPSTTIKYGLENDSHVTIEIYDITGQLITTLQKENQTQGWHSVIWNGTNQNNKQVPVGIYLSRITSNNEVMTTKLMLLK